MSSSKCIEIGALFSTTGWTAATEKSMLSATNFAIREINDSGGINGREVILVHCDPGGQPSMYRCLAQKLLSNSIKIILGCYTSDQRKAVIGEVVRENGLLCYPAQYEGFEYNRNTIYFGAVPNQINALLGQYIASHLSPRVFIVGSDYVWPRESGRIMHDLIRSLGGQVLGQRYLGKNAKPRDFSMLINEIKQNQPCVLYNNFVGESNIDFYAAYSRHAAENIRIVSLTTSEIDLEIVGPEAAAGHITAATYFQSQVNTANTQCRERHRSLFGSLPNTNMCWEAAYAQAHIVAQAMRRSNSSDVNLVRENIRGMKFDAPQGKISVDRLSSHAHVWPKIGVAGRNGQFDIVMKTDQAVSPDPYLASYELDNRYGRVATKG